MKTTGNFLGNFSIQPLEFSILPTGVCGFAEPQREFLEFHHIETDPCRKYVVPACRAMTLRRREFQGDLLQQPDDPAWQPFLVCDPIAGQPLVLVARKREPWKQSHLRAVRVRQNLGGVIDPGSIIRLVALQHMISDCFQRRSEAIGYV